MIYTLSIDDIKRELDMGHILSGIEYDIRGTLKYKNLQENGSIVEGFFHEICEMLYKYNNCRFSVGNIDVINSTINFILVDVENGVSVKLLIKKYAGYNTNFRGLMKDENVVSIKISLADGYDSIHDFMFLARLNPDTNGFLSDDKYVIQSFFDDYLRPVSVL
jgi:hypothetical protein